MYSAPSNSCSDSGSNIGSKTWSLACLASWNSNIYPILRPVKCVDTDTLSSHSQSSFRITMKAYL